ncbi:MucR family transcriptional regulator [Neoasaia chiangmaiensis]|uniref:MucR family transcriptional regulator n=1 Tax=Neoasaia chiangmaiensis TaxID=320497 RepID=A0A1U9KPX3_9PROT|nr:MucR family transcriptional regulator [Neoasaia chiangmaiensis]AQS87847.1 MucR family transcriptional regulator [Neoasaia chiangmaiensis]
MTSADKTMLVQKLTADIIRAYVSSNSVSSEALPSLIGTVQQTLADVDKPEVPLVVEKPVPAVSPKKSVFPDYIICLEDGKKLKLLRRHLKTAYNMTPQQYRERWDLPAEYPMVAPNYANHRSSLARKIGLGLRRDEG